MFGHWKREAEFWRHRADGLEKVADDRAEEINGLRVDIAWRDDHIKNVLRPHRDELKAKLRESKANLEAAQLQLKAEQKDNARLRAEVKAVDAQAADDRRHSNEMAAERDEWRSAAEQAAGVTSRIRLAFEGFYAQLVLISLTPQPTEDTPDRCDCRGVCPTAWDPECKSCRPRYSTSHDLSPDLDFDRQDG